MIRNTNLRGFTLIELLVVISIVAILSAVGLVMYSQVITQARDSKRKTDLRNIAQALEIYYQRNGRYPITNTGSWEYSTNDGGWIVDHGSPVIPFDNNYMGFVPVDPSSNGGNPWQSNQLGYAYFASACSSFAAGQYYILITQLENHNDPDRLGVKDSKYCDGNSLYTTYSWSAYSFIITSP